MHRSILLVGALTLGLPSLSAQVAQDLTSPRGTMFTFLDAVNAVRDGDQAAIGTAVATLDLSSLGVSATSNEARQAARQLWAALNRIRRVQPSELPEAGSLGASDTLFVYFPRAFNAEDEAIRSRVDIGNGVIALHRQSDGQWLFSAQTVAGIVALSSALSPLPASVQVDEEALQAPAWVIQLVPESLRTNSVLGVRYWQWIGLLVLIFLGVLADFVVRSMLSPVVRRVVRSFGVEVDPDAMTQLVRAAGLFAAAVLWLVFFPSLALVDAVYDVARAAFGVFAVLAAVFTAWRLTDLLGAVLIARAAHTDSKFDDILVPLVRKTAKLFVIAFGIIYGAQTLNIDIVPLLTGLGIGGLAFAFAAKDTIENLFGSVAVILDRPFEVGDWIVTGDVEGTVEELGFRSTRVRTFYNSLVTIPNAVLVRATVDNYGRRRYRRWKTILGVQYDTTPEQLLAFTEGIRTLIQRHPYTRKDYYQVWVNDFGPSSIDILLYMFHEVPDWSTELRERERLLVDVVRLANKLGVQFAFPTQTLHLVKAEPGEEPSPYQIPRGPSDQQAMRAGSIAAKEITRDQPWRQEKPKPVDYGGVDPGTFNDGGDG